MNTVVKAAAVQISPVLYSRQGTVEKIVKKVRELSKQGVQLATFPETVVPYYPYFSFSFVQPAFATGKEHQRLLEQSVTVPSAETRAIGEAAKDANMVGSSGVNERDGGTIYNTQLLFDADGTLIQRRRKITPTYHERMIWGQGNGSDRSSVPCSRSRRKPTSVSIRRTTANSISQRITGVARAAALRSQTARKCCRGQPIEPRRVP